MCYKHFDSWFISLEKMLSVRRRNIGRRTRKASQLHDLQVNETDEERRQRLEANRIRISQTRSVMTPEQWVQSSLTRPVGANAQHNLKQTTKRDN